MSGDLPIVPGTALALDIGVNTVTGQIFASVTSLVNVFERDPFPFSLPSGAQVDNITFSFVLSNNGADAPAASFQLGIIEQQIDFLTASSPVSLFPGQLPLLTSSFSILNTALLCTCLAGDSWSVDYVLSLEVSSGPSAAVPEPGTLAILGAGLAGVAALRRRRRTGFRGYRRGGPRAAVFVLAPRRGNVLVPVLDASVQAKKPLPHLRRDGRAGPVRRRGVAVKEGQFSQQSLCSKMWSNFEKHKLVL